MQRVSKIQLRLCTGGFKIVSSGNGGHLLCCADYCLHSNGIFSRNLADPVLEIITGKHLARGEYEHRWPEKGLYREVYRSLNNLATTTTLKKTKLSGKILKKCVRNGFRICPTNLTSIKGYGE
ncbi:MAG TPA: hypothetical protein GXZ50_07885 [Clostridia bacterium]|nr:hypothetical protein [Clostridia bacterium]